MLFFFDVKLSFQRGFVVAVREKFSPGVYDNCVQSQDNTVSSTEIKEVSIVFPSAILKTTPDSCRSVLLVSMYVIVITSYFQSLQLIHCLLIKKCFNHWSFG